MADLPRAPLIVRLESLSATVAVLSQAVCFSTLALTLSLPQPAQTQPLPVVSPSSYVAITAQDNVTGTRRTVDAPIAAVHLRLAVVTRYTPPSPWAANQAQALGTRGLTILNPPPRPAQTQPLPVVSLSPYVAIFAQDWVTGTIRPLNAPIVPPKPAWTQPVPAGYVYPIALRTWTLGPDTTLVLTPPIVFRVRTPVVTRYTPILPWRAIDAQPLGSSLGARSTITGSPKPAQTDPVPRGAVYPISLRTISQRATLALLAAPPPPAAPNLRAPLVTRYAKRPTLAPIQSQSSVTGSNLQTTLVPPAGGSQLVSGDWPNPDGPIYPTSLRTWMQSGRLPLLSSVPGPQQDQPNPRGYAYPAALRVFAQRLSLPLAAAPVIVPVRPFDWPNPRGYAYPVSLRTWTQNQPLTLKGQDQFFGTGGKAFDWPNPLGYTYPTSLRTWTQDATFRLAGAAPVRPFDWPNPRGYAYPTSLRTWTDSLERPILFAAPVAPFDWPNPAPAVPAIDLRTIAQVMPAPLLELLTTTPPLGVNIDLIVVLPTEGVQLIVCLNKAVDLDVTTNCTIELKVP